MNDYNNKPPKGCAIAFIVVMLVIIIAIISQCSSSNDSDNSSSRRSSSSSSSSSSKYKDHNGNGEYDLSDYMKDEAPDLYNDIKDRYEGLQD